MTVIERLFIMSVSDTLITLRGSARDLGKTSLARIPRKMERSCFICVNTNKSYRSNNGFAPLQRAIKVAELYKSFGYETYYMHNPHRLMFTEYFGFFLERTHEHLVFAYIGQGGDIEGGPESIIFDDAPLEDDEFISLVNSERAPGLKITMFHDFAAHESVFTNRQDSYDNNTICLSCVGTEDQFNDGAELFIDSVTREVGARKQISTQQLYDSLRIIFKRHQLKLLISGEPESFLKEPFAIFKPREENFELIR